MGKNIGGAGAQRRPGKKEFIDIKVAYATRN